MKAAILGFGTVGSGAYEILRDNAAGVTVKRILDLRVPEGYEGLVTTDYNDILNDPEIGIVAEAMGGLHPAYEFVTAAMKAGKSVVSANKHLICHYYRELHELAAECGVSLRFTPAAGGGIPWLYNLRRVKRADEILSLRGIMNGTTNYILDAMTNLGSDFADVLATAQQLGYAERDPSADIDGWDVRRKCALSASIAFDAAYTEDDIPTLGIREIRQEDIAFFHALGLVCKLLAFAVKSGDNSCAYVEPTLLPAGAVEGAVGTNYNCITLVGRYVGRLSFIGQGAGKYPTGHALAADMLDLAEGQASRPAALGRPTIDAGLCRHRYYVRTSATVPQDVTEKKYEGDKYMTVPMTPETAQALAHTLQEEDPHTFLAGWEENE